MKYFMVIIVLFSFVGCAMSPARRALLKDKWAVNVSMGGALVDEVQGLEWIPLPINLGVGTTYGISDGVTAGVNLYPFPLFAGTLVIEPVGVFNLMKTNGLEQLNSSVSIPTSISFQNGTVSATPTVGICPVFGGDKGIIYTVLEIGLDFTEDISPRFSAKVGGEYQAWDKATIGGEVGLLNIGEESTLSPLSRAGIGVPVFSVGSSIDVR